MIQKFETQLKEIEISIPELDAFVVESSDLEFIEMYLHVENLNVQHIIFKETRSTAKILFKIPYLPKQETEIHKPIIERLKRAHAIVKISKGKKVHVFGENRYIASKS